MSTSWTIETTAAGERSFESLGFDSDTAQGNFVNMRADVFSVAVPGMLITADPLFAFEEAVIIRSGRTYDEETETWSGGAIEFTGKRVEEVLDGRPDYEGVIYQFSGPWYDIDQTPYQQSIKVYTGDPDNLTTQLLTEVILFQKLGAVQGTLVALTNGQQVQECLQHVLDEYSALSLEAPFQIGTIEPAVPLPTYAVRDIKCSEAITHCMRASPNAVLWFDYTTSPPTVNVTEQASMSAYSLSLTGGDVIKGLKIIPREDLQARSVVIYFKRANNSNGFAWVETVKQKYPLDGAEGGPRVLIQTVDMEGVSRTDVSASLVCTPVVNERAWWQKYIPELQSYKIRAFCVGTMTVKDEAGAAVNLNYYPNVVDDGEVASWMSLANGTPVIAKRVTITVDAAYRLYDTEGTGENDGTTGALLEQIPCKQLTARVTLTNGVTGTYGALVSYVEAEAIPAGMAQAIYENLATLQYEGELAVVGEECAAYAMGRCLNLTNGRTAWATMRAIIQGIRKQYGSGITSLSFGPATQLGAGDLTEIFLVNRNRWTIYNPATQATAKLTGGSSVTLGENKPKENTQMGLPWREILSAVHVQGMSTNKCIAQLAPTSTSILLYVADEDGSELPASGKANICLVDLGGAPSGYREAKFREFVYKNADDNCELWHFWALMTEPRPV